MHIFIPFHGRLAVFLLLFSFVLSACSPVEERPQNEEGARYRLEDFMENPYVDIHVGDSLEGEGETLTLLSVEDSRCPSDVECFWAGEVRLVFDFQGTEGEVQTVYWRLPNADNGMMEYSFEGSEKGEPGPFVMGDFSVEAGASGVVPYPHSQVPTAQEDYTVGVLVKPVP